MNEQASIRGAWWGSLVGDALGVPVEFKARAVLEKEPVRGMCGFGTWNQPPGTWSDDGALLLCALESLAEKGWHAQDMGERFVRWYEVAHWTAWGRVFDIGGATRAALHRIADGVPAVEAGGRQERDNGNGSLMRIMPVSVVLAMQGSDEGERVRVLEEASAITHGHERARLACVFHGWLVRELLAGATVAEALRIVQDGFARVFAGRAALQAFGAVLCKDLVDKPVKQVRSGGYVLDTLEAAIWCLLTTSSFEECVLKAVNLGGDTDTTGCVAGGLAGLYYGEASIPEEWIKALPRGEDLRALFVRFEERFL